MIRARAADPIFTAIERHNGARDARVLKKLGSAFGIASTRHFNVGLNEC